MTYKEVKLLSQQFKKYAYDPRIRMDLIRRIWRHDKIWGLELFSKLVGINLDMLYIEGEIQKYNKQLNCKRRGRGSNNNRVRLALLKDIKEVAQSAAGSGEIQNVGGKRSTSKGSNGGLQNIYSSQAWQAALGQ